MKKLLISITLIYGLSTFGIANAAEVSDVPADHWAYPAVEALVKGGIIDGYNDGTFKGDKTLTRYEMAQVVEKAMDNSQKANSKQKALIDKLAAEFALEINKIDVRVKKIEENQKKMQKDIKSSANVKFELAQIWTMDNPPAQYENAKLQGSQQFSTRFRLFFTGDVNEKTSFYGRIASQYQDFGTGARDSSGTGYMGFDRAAFTFKDTLGFDSIILGRQAIKEQTAAVIYKAGDNDGLTLNKKIGKTSLRAGVYASKLEDTYGGGNMVSLFSATQQISPKFSITDAFMHSNIATTKSYLNYTFDGSNINSIGAVYKMGNWTLSGEYDRASLKNPINVARNPHGYSFQISNAPILAQYIMTTPTHMDLQKVGSNSWTVAYQYHPAGLTPAGFGSYVLPTSSNYKVNGTLVNAKDGTKGWLVSYQVIIAKGIQLGIDYMDLKSVVTGEKFNRAVSVGLVTDF